jgi:hypothetical protein
MITIQQMNVAISRNNNGIKLHNYLHEKQA